MHVDARHVTATAANLLYKKFIEKNPSATWINFTNPLVPCLLISLKIYLLLAQPRLTVPPSRHSYFILWTEILQITFLYTYS